MEDLLTYAETSNMLNMKLGTLYALVAQNRIPHVRLGRRFVRFSRAALEQWLRAHSVRPAEAVNSQSRPEERNGSE